MTPAEGAAIIDEYRCHGAHITLTIGSSWLTVHATDGAHMAQHLIRFVGDEPLGEAELRLAISQALEKLEKQ